MLYYKSKMDTRPGMMEVQFIVFAGIIRKYRRRRKAGYYEAMP
jgi:hypothetical protein